MKETFLIALFFVFCSCNNHQKAEAKNISTNEEKTTDTIAKNYFETIPYNSKFEFIVDKNYKGSNAVGCYGIGYHILIGSTLNSELPEKLSVLYHSIKPYNAKKGDTITIIPDENQDFENNNFGILYVTSDTIINGQTETYIVGSENKTIWAERIEL
ncbi:MAG TPA: hypothetical protein DEG69_03960 [Flavobacteriaceae bacterium]|jgi:hypothetical protein|nr:hypothetical protein [Flavobacteriaceae bacterium]|tara:strand:+ start:72724 stop:73194 length:471 start_codon:yes stop_codon:yes gene_type:complete